MTGADVHTVCRVCNFSRERFYQLTREPDFPPKLKLAHGEYDLQTITLWYIRRLQTELHRRGPASEPAALRRARLSLLSAQAEKAAMANRVKRGELVEADDVAANVTRRLQNCRDRLRGIPAGLGPQLTNKSTAHCVARLRLAFDEALSELDGAPSGRADRFN